jgi:hypothetical protein
MPQGNVKVGWSREITSCFEYSIKFGISMRHLNEDDHHKFWDVGLELKEKVRNWDENLGVHRHKCTKSDL